MKHYSLDGTWTLYLFAERDSPVRDPADLANHAEAAVPALVPGNVELDLERAGIIGDPFFGDGIYALRPYELYEWWYQRTFAPPDDTDARRIEIAFHGTDCVATYWLNGEEIGRSDNALIEHRFDITGRLRIGEPNTLTVRLASPVLEALRHRYDPSLETWGFGEEKVWVRKPAHSYGWDIMPRALSAGLWRSVELVVHDEHEITDVYVFTRSVTPERASLGLYFEATTAPERLLDLSLRVVGACGDSRFDVTRRVRYCAGTVYFDISDPKLWWPAGYGDAQDGGTHLYEATIQLRAGEEVLAQRAVTFGVRTVALERTETTSNEQPGQFLFRVNGVPILWKGTNWVPADAFHSRDATRIPEILAMARDLGCNSIRCWGGGVYEDHGFYDLCDRFGLLVWQDFAMACSRYPQDPEFLDAMRREALSVVRKLRNHPSLALWCGDNECDMLYTDPEKNHITRRVLPDAVFQADPYRPYLPSSPYVAHEAVGHPELMPEQHLWGPRDYYKSDFYTHHTAHFVSEIGYHGCPNVSSMRRFIDEDHLWPWQDNDQWITHCTAPAGRDDPYRYRIALMANQIRELFGHVPEDLETFVLASQISQAEAKKAFIEMTRLRKWRRTGVIWWNLMDGWPQFSDAVVDYYFGKKLAYPYIKRAQLPVCLMVDEPRDWHVHLSAGNDTRLDAEGTYRVWDADTGETLLEGDYRSRANETTTLGAIAVSRSDQKLLLIEWTVGDLTCGNHYLLGTPPLSLERYRGWLGKIAALQPAFVATDVGR
ncbi:MAG: glycoside hydrolase family 2 [Anaerolineae bacterium]|nr:glycoside hydrolase family 2 [Anaerolineae bacterium]